MSATTSTSGCSVQGISNGLDVVAVTPIGGAPPISAESPDGIEATVTAVSGGAFNIDISINGDVGIFNAPYDFIIAP